MAKECLWYNGETSAYELLDFDPNGLTKEQIIEKAKKEFDSMGIFGEAVDKALETLYLIDVSNLESLKKTGNKELPNEIKKQMLFALEDDNEVMTSALHSSSDLDKENKQMNRELIKEHEKIIAKINKNGELTKKDLCLIRDANEIHLNDEENFQEHHKQAVELNKWLDKELGILTKDEAARILEKHLDKDKNTPKIVYRALHNLWEEETPNDKPKEPAFDKEGKCKKCGSKVSFADETNTVVYVGNEIVKNHPGDITNRNCVRCTYPEQYSDYEDYDNE